MDNGPAIRVRELRRHFGEIKAVDGVTFEVDRGEIFSLLGPNGAGKSTIISMLSCLLRPNGGEAKVMGYDVITDSQQVKAAIGVVPQEIALYEDLSARENLLFWGKMYGLRAAALNQRVDEVLDLIGLTDRQKGRVGKFSGGMKRRVNIGVALMHRPEVIIMDEPTVGIDPQSRRHILDGVLALNRQGATLVYTTHYMEEAQELSDHIAIMDQGKIIARGTHDELVQIVGQRDRIDLALSEESEPLAEGWRAVEGVDQVSPEDGLVSVLADDSNRVLPRLFEVANQQGIRITSVAIHEPNLESVFLHLTGRALRDWGRPVAKGRR
jgi:ABC-2 type transport system ATP-binding protein